VLYTRKNRSLQNQSKVNCKYPGCLCLHYPLKWRPRRLHCLLWDVQTLWAIAPHYYPIQIVLFCLFCPAHRVVLLNSPMLCYCTELFVKLNLTRLQLHMFTQSPRPRNLIITNAIRLICESPLELCMSHYTVTLPICEPIPSWQWELRLLLFVKVALQRLSPYTDHQIISIPIELMALF